MYYPAEPHLATTPVLKCFFCFIMLIKKKTPIFCPWMVSWHPYYILSPELVLWLLLHCQIFGHSVYWFHLTHIGYLQIVSLICKIDWLFPEAARWWKVTKVIKGNYSLFHLIRVFMAELFDVANKGAGIAQWLEHRTRDWKVAGSNPCRNGGRIFFSRVDFLCWLLFRYPFHPRVTTVARKKSRSFCQKCRWQVTVKHAYTLRMWILLNRASALVTTCP